MICTCKCKTRVVLDYIIRTCTVHVNKKFPNLPVTEQNSNSTATVQQQYSTVQYRNVQTLRMRINQLFPFVGVVRMKFVDCKVYNYNYIV